MEGALWWSRRSDGTGEGGKRSVEGWSEATAKATYCKYRRLTTVLLVVSLVVAHHSVFLLPGAALVLCFVMMFFMLKEIPGQEDLGRGNKGGEKVEGKVTKIGGSGLNLSAWGEGEEKEGLLDHDKLELGESAVNVNTPLIPKKDPSPPKATVGELFRSPTFICYLIAIVNLCWVRDGLITWIYSFLESQRGSALGPDTAAMIGGAVTLGGFLGGVLCGLASDKMFGGNRSNPILMFSVFQVIFLAALYYAGTEGKGDEVMAGLMFGTAVFMLGNYTLWR